MPAANLYNKLDHSVICYTAEAYRYSWKRDVGKACDHDAMLLARAAQVYSYSAC